MHESEHDHEREDFERDPDEYDEAFQCPCGRLVRDPSDWPLCGDCREEIELAGRGWTPEAIERQLRREERAAYGAPDLDPDDPLAFDRERERRFFG